MAPAPTSREKPFPRRCFSCGERRVNRIEDRREVRVKYDGATYDLTVVMPVNRCENCGATTLDNASHDATDHALRERIGLLHPHEIRAARTSLGLTQQQLASKIGCAAESLSRWENGLVVQSRVYDRMLRAFFHLPALRDFLASLDGDSSLGRAV